MVWIAIVLSVPKAMREASLKDKADIVPTPFLFIALFGELRSITNQTKKMKTFKMIGIALTAICMCMNFTSCSSDDGEENDYIKTGLTINGKHFMVSEEPNKNLGGEILDYHGEYYIGEFYEYINGPITHTEDFEGMIFGKVDNNISTISLDIFGLPKNTDDRSTYLDFENKTNITHRSNYEFFFQIDTKKSSSVYRNINRESGEIYIQTKSYGKKGDFVLSFEKYTLWSDEKNEKIVLDGSITFKYILNKESETL